MKYKTILATLGIGLALYTAFNAGRSQEREKHKEDYIKIEKVQDISYTTNKPKFKVEAIIGGKKVVIPEIEYVLKQGTLNEVIEKNDIAKDTFGTTSKKILGVNYEVPVRELEYQIKEGYQEWDNGGYGNYGYKSSIVLTPKEN